MKRKLTLLIAMINFVAISHAQWQLTGNSISSTDFLGSTNSQPLVFKVNNSQSGLIDHVAKNTILGYQALLSNTTGAGNTGMGYLTLYSNTSGSNNIAHGQISLYNNTTGSYNIGLGSAALWANTSGSQNVAIGFGALDNNATADNNVACGYKALFSNTTGTGNSAFGHQALYSNSTTSQLTAIGYQALYSNTSGTGNTGAGYEALYSNTTGSGNVANGYHALYSNTTKDSLTAVGYYALASNTSGVRNTAIGYNSQRSNTIGYDNTAIGSETLHSNTSGNLNTATGSYTLWYNSTGGWNTAYGALALYNNSTGNNNVADGVNALNNNTTGYENTACGVYSLGSNYSGTQNTAIGEFALFSNYSGSNNTGLGFNANISANYNNTTVVGNSATGTASNQVRVGNSSVTSIGGQVGWTTLSDGRAKKNIKSNIPGLSFINKLKPVSYNLDEEAVDKIIQRPVIKTPDGKIIQEPAELIAARKQKEQIIYTGFVAQDVEKAAKELNYDFSGVDAPKNNKDLYGLRYADFVAPLVKAVQELSAKNDSLESENRQMQSQLSSLIKRIGALEIAQQECCNSSSKPSISNSQSIAINGTAKLEQNAPNPFNSTTIIRYYIPKNSSTAQIIVSDLSSHILKNISIENKGEGQLTIKAGTLPSGNYIYSLVVDGRRVDNKQMVLTK